MLLNKVTSMKTIFSIISFFLITTIFINVIQTTKKETPNRQKETLKQHNKKENNYPPQKNQAKIKNHFC